MMNDSYQPGDDGPDFDGPVYDRAADHKRLSKQHERIRDLMLDGEWRTIQEICDITGDPHSSVSAQLRHLRKLRFGAWIVEKRHRGPRSNGLWEYQLLAPTPEHLAAVQLQETARLTAAEEDAALEALRKLTRKARKAGIETPEPVIRLGQYLRARQKQRRQQADTNVPPDEEAPDGTSGNDA